MLQMSSVKQKETCVICMEEIIAKDQTKIDSCEHTYCRECIQTWVRDSENCCPCCKKVITQLTFLDENQQEVIEKVQPK